MGIVTVAGSTARKDQSMYESSAESHDHLPGSTNSPSGVLSCPNQKLLWCHCRRGGGTVIGTAHPGNGRTGTGHGWEMGEAEAKAEAEGPGRGEARSWSLPVAVGALEGRRAGGQEGGMIT
ncbi:hypothetical protein LIA77_04129 [Sarocladium implicatum]|nr:hypothetical protein LIA77_04129 [Sarocladium implicatum]